MRFKEERQQNIPCVNTICDHQGDDRFLAKCDSELDNGDPKYNTCLCYLPEHMTHAVVNGCSHLNENNKCEFADEVECKCIAIKGSDNTKEVK
jgi:hypothetical protein